MPRASDSPADEVRHAIRESIECEACLRQGGTVVVGFSGGADSLTLLHALVGLSRERPLAVRAAHLNHCLRGPEADADAAFVQAICEDWGVPLVIERQDTATAARERGLAIEEAARQVRYAFLARAAKEVGACAMAVGHNADDQVETVLMHFLRGSGLAGLRGMLPSQPLADLRLDGSDSVPPGLRLIRPLLSLRRHTIEAYCREHSLQPRFDRSNLDTTYFRNRLRHELIPSLETYNPNVREVILRTADVVGADHDYLCAQASRAWEAVVVSEATDQIVVHLERFRAQPLSLQRALVRRAVARLRPLLRDVGLVHVEQAVAAVRRAHGAGKAVTLPDGLLLRIGYTRFAIADASFAGVFEGDYPQLPEGIEQLPVSVPGQVSLAGGWHLSLAVVPRDALPTEALAIEHLWLAYLDVGACSETLALRVRREGERMQPLGLEGHGRKLGELMINLKVPAISRRRYPILACGELVLWLPGYRVDHRARVSPSTREVLVARMWRE